MNNNINFHFGDASCSLENDADMRDVENASFAEINSPDADGNTPLICASANGNARVVQMLVDQGACVNHQNHQGETALYWAVSQGFTSIVEILIESGANANIVTLDGRSPSHVAAGNGNGRLLQILYHRGAFMNAQDEELDTPLHEAVRAGHMETIFFLVKEAKVDTKVSNEDQETPLDLAHCLKESDPEVYGQIINFLNSVPAARNQAEKIEPFFYPFKPLTKICVGAY